MAFIWATWITASIAYVIYSQGRRPLALFELFLVWCSLGFMLLSWAGNALKGAEIHHSWRTSMTIVLAYIAIPGIVGAICTAVIIRNSLKVHRLMTAKTQAQTPVRE